MGLENKIVVDEWKFNDITLWFCEECGFVAPPNIYRDEIGLVICRCGREASEVIV